MAKSVVCHTPIIRTYAICAFGAGAGKDKKNMGTSKGKQEKPKRKPGRPRVEVKIYKAPPDADYYRADDIAEIMGLSRSRSYKLIQDMRAELMSEGKLPKYFPLGRVPKAEFNKRMMIEG